MKAHALGKIFESKKNIVIMGHRMQDIDSFGAAIGMYCFARHIGKDARVVINEITPSVKPFYDRFVAREELYLADFFPLFSLWLKIHLFKSA